MLQKWKNLDLQWKILLGIIAGAILGIVLNKFFSDSLDKGVLLGLLTFFKYGGDIFVRLLRMLIAPLVFASIYMAVINLGDLKELGRVGVRTISYYLLTTGLAVLLGIFLVNLTHPGKGMLPETLKNAGISLQVPDKVSAQQVGTKSATLIILDTLIEMIPKNFFDSLARGDILQIIFFSLFLAIVGTTFKKEEGIAVINDFIGDIDLMMQKAVSIVMEVSPYFIFFLVAKIFTELGVAALLALGKYAFTVVLGLLIHSMVVLPLLVLIIAKQNPFRLMKEVLPALLTAWSTASSAATLPMTMNCLEKSGVQKKTRDFVLPLGATINMDGTALYESVAVIFIAEILGFNLTLGSQVIIFFTATLAGIGAAAIPGAGLVTMGIVLAAVGLPLDGIGLILAIDRILDQFRTTVNVWGDCTAAVVIDHFGKKDDQSELTTEPKS